MKRQRPPMQPVVRDANGTVRFQENVLVRYLLDWATAKGCGMNELSLLPGIPRADREQFAQLIGYNISGFGELSYVRDSTFDRAAKREQALLEKEMECG